VSIDAGDMTAIGTAIGATGITGSDIADNNNGTDLYTQFDASADETTLNEYRLIVVKNSSLPTFNLAAAQALAPTEYLSIAPTGLATYAQVLSAGATDSDGDAIVINQDYTLFVHGVADGVIATIDVLSAGSSLMLNITADATATITGTDIGDNANGTDLQVDFNAAANESGILEYRAIVVKASTSAGFTLADAQGAIATSYETFTPSGGPYSGAFNAGTTDTDGDAIEIGVPYSLFVLSVADGTNANIDSLSAPSADVTINVLADIASNIVGTDIADNAVTATDLQVTFDAAANENSVFAYRVIAVKASAAGSFTLNDAESLPVDRFMPVTPNGGSQTVVFHSSKFDSDGDAIMNNVPYTIFVMSFADGVTANAANMASSSSDVTLTFIDTSSLDENDLSSTNVYAGSQGIVVTPGDQLTNKLNIQVLNSLGQILKTSSTHGEQKVLSTSTFRTGVYFVRLTNTSGTTRTERVFIK